MIGVKATIRIGGIMDTFRRLSRPDLKQTFKEMQGPARFDQRDHDNKELAPDGSWPALHPSTVARRARMAKSKRRRAKPRKLLGRLPKAMQNIVSAKSLIVRSRVKWSLAHQKGAIVGRGSRLPRRQFMWISDWLKGQARKLLEQTMMRVFHGRK